jgi:hypothetical protein
MYLEMSSEMKSSEVTFAAEEASLSSCGVNGSEGDVLTKRKKPEAMEYS